MNNREFIKYTAERFGIEENTIETMIDIFASSLQEIIISGNKVIIDEIGEFVPEQALSSPSNQYTVFFKPSQKLITEI